MMISSEFQLNYIFNVGANGIRGSPMQYFQKGPRVRFWYTQSSHILAYGKIAVASNPCQHGKIDVKLYKKKKKS